MSRYSPPPTTEGRRPERNITTARALTAEDAYLAEHAQVMESFMRVDELLQALPAPTEEQRVDWSDCGSLCEINRHLRELIAFMTGDES